MEIQLTPAQEDFVRLGIESGRFATADEAVKTALLRWENEERHLFELIACIRVGEIDLESGNYSEISPKTSHAFFEDLKRDARSPTSDSQ